MKPREREWVSFHGTHILMELWKDYHRPEWRVVGFVMFRQIYPMFDGAWQAWWTEGRDELIGSRGHVDDAKFALESELNKRRDYATGPA